MTIVTANHALIKEDIELRLMVPLVDNPKATLWSSLATPGLGSDRTGCLKWSIRFVPYTYISLYHLLCTTNRGGQVSHDCQRRSAMMFSYPAKSLQRSPVSQCRACKDSNLGHFNVISCIK